MRNPAALTEVERNCIAFVAKGLRIEEIAHQLGLEAAAVAAHLDSVRQKLSAVNMMHAVARALRLGIVPIA